MSVYVILAIVFAILLIVFVIRREAYDKKASSQIVPLDDTFDRLIEGIETRIKEGYFNKEYLV